jgi:hypothetical protein
MLLKKGQKSGTGRQLSELAWADRPAEIFPVIGLSRADVPAVAKAGGHHPGSQQHLANFISRCHDEGWFSSPYATKRTVLSRVFRRN